MGNLLGEPFDDFVNEQIRTRQRLHGASDRSTRNLQYLNSRNAWIKLASGCILEPRRVAMFKDNPLIIAGDDTAKNNVLFNGLSNNNGQQREGITGNNRAYGVGGTGQFGYSPMPGITDMDFKCLNRGSIKKATLNIKAHNRNQFDMIDVLYLRLGYSVMLEWGYDKYINNKGTLIQQGPTLIDEWFFKTNSKNYRDAINKIQQKREETFGNYDGAFGVVSNFSWTFASDGTYDIKLEIISMGDIIESLKVNLPPTILDISSTVGGQSAIKRFAALLESQGTDTVSQQDFYSTLYPGLKTALANWWFGVQNGTYSTGIPGPQQMQLPSINAGKNFRNNWTGRDDIDIEGDPTFDDNKTYGSDWIYGYGETPQDLNLMAGQKISQGTKSSSVPKLYLESGSSFTVYTNSDISQIDEGFKFDDEKLKAVWAGVNKVWQAGLATSNNGNRPIEDIESPFGDDFVRNMRGPLQSLNVSGSGYRTEDTTFYEIKYKIPYPKNGEYIEANFKEVYLKYRKAGNYVAYNDVREQWTALFEEIKKDGTNADAWKFLLNNEYQEVNFSSAIGINLQDVYRGVYNEFAKRKLADAFPLTPEEETRLNELNNKDEEGELTDAEKREKELTKQRLERITKDYVTKNRNRIYRIFYDLRQTWSKSKEKNIRNLFPGEVNGSTGDIGLSFLADNIVKLNIEPLDNQWYIRLGFFLEILNNNIIPKINNNGRKIPMITIDTNAKENICYVIDNTYSLNLKKILVQNQHFISGIDSNGNPVSNPIFPKLPKFVNIQRSASGGMAWGNIMNIYFNFNRLEEIFDSTIANDEVSLYNALKSICDDINECLGGVNKLEPIVDEPNIVKFIDQTAIPNLEMIGHELGIEKFSNRSKDKEVKFEAYGLNYTKSPTESNFVRNIGLTTQISKNYATMITIGATANGSIPGTEATAFSKWNVGIVDRFKKAIEDANEKEEPVAPISSSVGITLQQEYSEMIASQDDVFTRYGLNETNNDLKTISDNLIKFNTSTTSDFYKLMQSQNSFEEDKLENESQSKNNKTLETSVGFIPFNLKLEMDGLSGIKIYNRIQVAQNFLPSNYDDTLEFIITQVNHKLSGNDWVTNLETTATSKSVMKK